MRSTTWKGLCRPPPRLLSLRAVAHHETTTANTPHRVRRYGRTLATRHLPFSETPRHNKCSKTTHQPEILTAPELRPPEDRRNNFEAWLSILEPHLPDHLRDASVPRGPPADIYGILADARDWGSINLLEDIGFSKGRWQAVQWLLNKILDTASAVEQKTTLADVLLSIPKTGPQNMEELLDSKSTEWRESETLMGFAPAQDSSSYSLWQMSMSKDGSKDLRAHHFIGEVWFWLGTCLRKLVRDSDPSTQSHAMDAIMGVMNRMYRDGLITTKVLNSDAQSQASSQHERPGLPHIDTLISALDATLLATSRAHDSARVKPAACFEFVLWACVHGGWANVAARLLTPSKMMKGRNKTGSGASWSVKTSHLAEGSTSVVSQKQQYLEMQKQSLDKPWVSDDIVIATIDGLVADVKSTANDTASDVMGNVRRLKLLKSLLEFNFLGLGTASWDSVVARLSEHPAIDLALNPRFMTSILGMAGHYGFENTTANCAGQNNHNAHPSFVFDASASTIGLYHQTLQAQIHARDVQGAMQTLGNLRSFTDTNKRRSMDDFMAKLENTGLPKAVEKDIKWKKLISGGKTVVHKFTGEAYPAHYPSIPRSILAGLLDLTTDAEMEEVGQWMVHSEEVDGPLISPEFYADSKLAPALVRHAAAADDTQLLRAVARVQGSNVSGETLVALCYSYTLKANWKGALRVISMSNKFAPHTWTAMDVALVAKALIGHIQSPLRPKSVTGAEFMLQKLLRGDLFLGLGPPDTAMEELSEVVSSIDGNMASLCENVVRPGGLGRFHLPVECFNTLLEGISRAYGSLRSQDLYMQWCKAGQREQKRSQLQMQKTQDGHERSIAELFGQKPSELAQTREANQGQVDDAPAIFEPNLATIRIVIDQALKESRSSGDDYIADTVDEGLPTVKASFTEAETMEWAAQILRQDFGMTDADVDYELQGYLSAQRPGAGGASIEPLYRQQTLLIWRALSGTRTTWVNEIERQMRAFARSSMERQMVTEPIGPAERYFVHCLAEEFGLSSEAAGEGTERAVALTKSLSSQRDYPLPATRVGDAAERYFAL